MSMACITTAGKGFQKFDPYKGARSDWNKGNKIRAITKGFFSTLGISITLISSIALPIFGSLIGFFIGSANAGRIGGYLGAGLGAPIGLIGGIAAGILGWSITTLSGGEVNLSIVLEGTLCIGYIISAIAELTLKSIAIFGQR